MYIKQFQLLKHCGIYPKRQAKGYLLFLSQIIPELKFQGEASDLREDLDFIWVALTSMMTLAEVGRSNLKALRLQEIPGGLSMRVDIELDPTDLMYHARQFRDTLKGFPENVFPEAYLEKYGVPEVEVVFPQRKFPLSNSLHKQQIQIAFPSLLLTNCDPFCEINSEEEEEEEPQAVGWQAGIDGRGGGFCPHHQTFQLAPFLVKGAWRLKPPSTAAGRTLVMVDSTRRTCCTT